ncbi:MAG: AlpA family transcriptional regulator [Candidatus Accumulibacter sp.]|jgi:prophage regulatory protein|nr:AlpA family transcriptional regulator [Accumulibacter sp.]
MSKQSHTNPPVILRRNEVEARTGLARSTIYARIAADAFPRPVPLGRKAVGWIESEIQAWIDARIVERDLPLAVKLNTLFDREIAQ